MLRTVLDANVLVSAAIRPSGPPGQIVAELLTRQAFEMIISPAIAADIEDGLRQPKIRKYLHDPDDARLWVADFMAVADVVADSGFIAGVCRDTDDEVVLAAAVEGRADKIVTGNRDLLVLSEHEGIPIVTPREFLDLIERLSGIGKRAAYGDEEIRIGTRGREEASLIATRKLAEMREEIARLRRRLAMSESASTRVEMEQPFAALQSAVDAGAFATGAMTTRRRRVMPGVRMTSELSREEQARLGSRDSREPRFRRPTSRA